MEDSTLVTLDTSAISTFDSGMVGGRIFATELRRTYMHQSDPVVTLFSVDTNIDMSLNKEFHFREVAAWILSRMNIELGKKYKLREIIDNVIETGNQIDLVEGKHFDSDLYIGVKDQITTAFTKHVLLNVLIEEDKERESFDYILEHINDEVTIDKAMLTTNIAGGGNEYLLKLYRTDIPDNLNVPVLVIRIPY